MRFSPSTRLLALAGGLLAAGIAEIVLPEASDLWSVAALGVLLFAAADMVAGYRLQPPLAQREVASSLPLGVWNEVSLQLHNPGRRTLRFAVQDFYPPQMEVRGLPQSLSLKPGTWVRVGYGVRPLLRGETQFGLICVRMDSPLGLWRIERRLGTESLCRVYPNFAALTNYALFAIDHRLSRLGVLRRRRRGEGMEFHQLREYRQGDSERQIDWKATARFNKLISREYQDERDQQVVFMIDCGRRMAAKDDLFSHFDHTLNALLLLSYVSLRQGDAVGLLTMNGPERYCAPRKSGASVNVILNQVFDLQPSILTSDYYGASVELMKRVRKRSLVVILSNLRDEDDDTLTPALALLGSRHLVLFASLREKILSRALHTRVNTFDRAVTYAATADYLRERALVFRRIARGGTLCIDVEPEQLPMALVNSYLDIKRQGRL
jgi:uncharacterized protein (DUF58 family)